MRNAEGFCDRPLGREYTEEKKFHIQKETVQQCEQVYPKRNDAVFQNKRRQGAPEMGTKQGPHFEWNNRITISIQKRDADAPKQLRCYKVQRNRDDRNASLC